MEKFKFSEFLLDAKNVSYLSSSLLKLLLLSVLLNLLNRAEKYFSNGFILVLNMASSLCSLIIVISVVNFKLLKPSQNKNGRKIF